MSNIPKNPTLIGLIGYTGAGKSTAARHLHRQGYHVASFGALIRAEVAQAWGINVDRMAISTAAKMTPEVALALGRCKDPYFRHWAARQAEVLGKPRSLIDAMQAWGDYRRSDNRHYWIDRMFGALESVPREQVDRIVLTGICTPAEEQRVRAWGGLLIRIHSPRVQTVSDHATQDLHRLRSDELIYNAGRMQHMAQALDAIIGTTRTGVAA